jgi:hypothetical protein
MPGGELFPPQIDDAEVELILNGQVNSAGAHHVEDIEYLYQRRRLLGPVADIRHPEFGRPNLPDETFSVAYAFREEEVCSESLNSPKTEMRVVQKIREFIFDHQGNWISCQDL